MKDLKAKIIGKIHRLKADGVLIEYLQNEEYEQNAVRIGKIKICQQQVIDSDGNIEWPWFVYVDFLRHHILYGSDAEDVLLVITNNAETVLENYLNS